MHPVNVTHQRPQQAETFPAKLTGILLILVCSQMGRQEFGSVKRPLANVAVKTQLVLVFGLVQLQALVIGEHLSADRTHEVLLIGVSLHVVS